MTFGLAASLAAEEGRSDGVVNSRDTKQKRAGHTCRGCPRRSIYPDPKDGFQICVQIRKKAGPTSAHLGRVSRPGRSRDGNFPRQNVIPVSQVHKI
jgi:hypothetical protein